MMSVTLIEDPIISKSRSSVRRRVLNESERRERCRGSRSTSCPGSKSMVHYLHAPTEPAENYGILFEAMLGGANDLF